MWTHLQTVAALSRKGDLAPLLCGIEMLRAAELQFERFRDALSDRDWMGRWAVEVHFFLVAAYNASQRLAGWAKSAEEKGSREAIRGLTELKELAEFRHHQEHLEERFPGGRRENRSRLSAPGNETIRIEGEGSVISINNLENGRFLTFGNEKLDLLKVNAIIVATAERLARYLQED